MNSSIKIGFGGGCHWCTEAIFQHLKGVRQVEQGWIASVGEVSSFSEAVIVHFNPESIDLNILIKIHLFTHKSTVTHSMRNKYRSAVYTFSKEQTKQVEKELEKLKTVFADQIITKVYPFKAFKASGEEIKNYYAKNPQKPFCETYINPKLKLLLSQFSDYADKNKLAHLRT